jgi:hypothetical protein
MAEFKECARKYGLTLAEVFRLHHRLFDAHYGLVAFDRMVAR